MKYKDKLYFSGAVEVRRSHTHGYGVFANRDIPEAEIIEECYGLTMMHQWSDVDETLKDYVFAVAPLKSGLPSSSAVLGLGMIYNHGEEQNVRYKYLAEYCVFVFSASRDIEKDEELLVHYGKNSFSAERMKLKNG